MVLILSNDDITWKQETDIGIGEHRLVRYPRIADAKGSDIDCHQLPISL
jgi:hypothetical protein